jgi:hypothetical protein
MTIADKINEAIATGHTVHVATYGRVTRIKASYKGVKYWADLGFPMFKMSGDVLMMIEGYKDDNTPKYVNASGAKITAHK